MRMTNTQFLLVNKKSKLLLTMMMRNHEKDIRLIRVTKTTMKRLKLKIEMTPSIMKILDNCYNVPLVVESLRRNLMRNM